MQGMMEGEGEGTTDMVQLTGVRRKQLLEVQRRIGRGECPSPETMALMLMGLQVDYEEEEEVEGTKENEAATQPSPRQDTNPIRIKHSSLETRKKKKKKQLPPKYLQSDFHNLVYIWGAAGAALAAVSAVVENSENEEDRIEVSTSSSSTLPITDTLSRLGSSSPVEPLSPQEEDEHDRNIFDYQPVESHSYTHLTKEGVPEPSKPLNDSVFANRSDSVKAQLKMIVAAYAVREEGLAGKTAAAAAEVRRYQAIVSKQEEESTNKRKRADKQVAVSLERQAELKDKVEELQAEIQRMKEAHDKKCKADMQVFRRDIERVEEIYKSQLESVTREQLRTSDTVDHLKVRGREELIEAGRAQEREKCERINKQALESHKKTTEEMARFHNAVLGKEKQELAETRTDLQKLRKSATEEVRCLRKQVEYLFEYSRNLSRIVIQLDPSKQTGVSLLGKKKYKKASGSHNGAIGVEPVDLTLLQHVQTCWYKTQQYLADMKGYRAKQPSFMNFPLTFVSASDFCEIDNPVVPRGVWNRKMPKKEAVEQLIQNLEQAAYDLANRRWEETSNNTTQIECLKCKDRERTPDNMNTDDLQATITSLQKDNIKYKDQFRQEVLKNRDMRINLESKSRVMQRIKSHQQELTPRKPQSSRLSRPMSAAASRTY